MSEPTDEQVVIICMRYPKETGGITTRGSSLGKCANCEHAITIAPSSMSISTQRYEKARFICIPCFFEVVKQGGMPEIKTFPEQWEEIKDNLNRKEGM